MQGNGSVKHGGQRSTSKPLLTCFITRENPEGNLIIVSEV